MELYWFKMECRTGPELYNIYFMSVLCVHVFLRRYRIRTHPETVIKVIFFIITSRFAASGAFCALIRPLCTEAYKLTCDGAIVFDLCQILTNLLRMPVSQNHVLSSEQAQELPEFMTSIIIIVNRKPCPDKVFDLLNNYRQTDGIWTYGPVRL